MPTIQQILQDHFDELAASGTLSAPQQRAGWALRKCRTAALGRSRAALSQRTRGAGVVQLLPASGVSPVQRFGERALAAAHASQTDRLRALARDLHHPAPVERAVAAEHRGDDGCAVRGRARHAARAARRPAPSGCAGRDPARAAHLEPRDGAASAPARAGQRRGHARGRVGHARGAATFCPPRW